MNDFHHRIYSEIKSRRIRQAIAIYIGFALPSIGILSLLETRFAIPHVWFDRYLILLVFGLVFTVTAAWYHGRRKVEPFRRSEVLLYVLCIVCALAAVIIIPGQRRPVRPARGEVDKSIAVMPFLNFSGNKEDEYFTDGITEDILTQLSKISDLRVLSRTTMMQYRGTTKNVREIGKELNVGTILEGSVRREGNRVRIVGQLIDAVTDEHLWAETYDRELKAVFTIQTEVARNIAQALAAVLSPQEQERITTVPTSVIDAYPLYLRGRFHYGRYTREDNEKAIAFFTQATSHDPSYGLAYAGLSDAFSQRVQRYGYAVNWLDSAVSAARRAIDLSPQSAEGYKALGLAYDNLGMSADALEQYERAVVLNPNYALAIRNIGLLSYRTGKLGLSLQSALTVVSLAPDDVMGYVQAGMAFQALGMDSASAAWYQKGRHLDPENPFPLVGLGWLYLTQGDASNARTMTDTLVRLAPSLPPALELRMNINILDGEYQAAYKAYKESCEGPNASGAYILLRLRDTKGSRETAMETIERCRRLIERGSESPSPPFEAASAFAVLSAPDSALTWMHLAVDAGWRDYRWAMKNPLFDGIRSDGRFVRLLSDVEQKVVAMRSSLTQPLP